MQNTQNWILGIMKTKTIDNTYQPSAQKAVERESNIGEWFVQDHLVLHPSLLKPGGTKVELYPSNRLI